MNKQERRGRYGRGREGEQREGRKESAVRMNELDAKQRLVGMLTKRVITELVGIASVILTFLSFYQGVIIIISLFHI